MEKSCFEIIPRKGVGPIQLGMKRDEIRKKMAELGFELGDNHGFSGSLDYFGKESALQVEYEKDDTASFIGIGGGEEFDCTIYEVDPFDTPAEELFRLLAEKDGTPDTPYNEMEFVFKNIIVTLYEADSQYDRKGTRAIWGQIGLGDERYLAG